MSTPTATAAVDLVNAALLGTDRRPVPAPDGTDPAAWLLEAAASRRAATLVAGATTRVALPPTAPDADRPLPPPAARAVLDEILLVTGSEPVNLWLRAALDAGCGLAPEHWAALLDRARRATDLDRRRLGVALGARGLWFARQNPAWASVVRAVEAATSGEEPERDGTLTATGSAAAEEVLRLRLHLAATFDPTDPERRP